MNKLLAAGFCVLLTGISQAWAYEAGDVVVRFGPTYVDPAGDGALDGALDVDSNTQLGVSTSYMLNPNFGVAVLAATPFKHDITLNGATIGSTKHLPPTVTAQYHFNTGTPFRPYVGAGVNYTQFFSEKSTLGKLDLSHSWGLAAEAGFDYALTDKWAFNAGLWYADIDTKAKLDGSKLDTVKIDPWVYMLGMSYTF
ncbi:MAG: outer membrane beta-barrel protein [Thiothrix sp.]|nr:outer membrane beta-barrel protein [Thiothrix sp.]HPQ95122.1 OmpW family outer membrane protein [Thiolinea sp.]